MIKVSKMTQSFCRMTEWAFGRPSYSNETYKNIILHHYEWRHPTQPVYWVDHTDGHEYKFKDWSSATNWIDSQLLLHNTEKEHSIMMDI